MITPQGCIIQLCVDSKPHSTISVEGTEAIPFKKNGTTGSVSFAFPLPGLVYDGAPHTLHVRSLGSENPSHYETEKNTLCFQQGGCHGQVQVAKGQLIGWVAFSERPNPLPFLRIEDEQQQLNKLVPLIPLPSESGEPDSFLATFQLPLASTPLPARVFCGDKELQGSPCQIATQPIGLLEKCNGYSLDGWAFDINHPDKPIELLLKIDGQVNTRFRPNLRRPDIARQLKLPEDRLGIVGFQIPLPEILFDGEPHTVTVELFEHNYTLKGSGQRVCIPKTFEAFNANHSKKTRRPRRCPHPEDPEVSVIILNRNGEAPLSALFESWHQHNSEQNIEFVVVDHASDDGSLALLKDWQERLPIRIITLSYNDSFSASCNRGVANARGRNLLFMNNDIVWLHDALPPMLESLQNDPAIGAVGLKLLKSTDDGRQEAREHVQHLGVRVKLSGPAYWPYEATPNGIESTYGRQYVPIVTAAVMLCRREDFIAAGKFDTSYFYGFEDVEFCLRLRQRLNKTILCRNDLVALHRHGHTRLSGRATDIFERVVDNADVLQSHIGLWLKQAFWKSLFTGDNDLTAERLTIGLVTDESEADGKTSALRNRATQMASQLQNRYPHARIVFVPPRLGWYKVRQIHLLVVGHPEYDIRQISERREDLIIIAWINGQTRLWRNMPWWPHFDIYLASHQRQVVQLAPHLEAPIATSTTPSPLGQALTDTRPPLRIALLAVHQVNSDQLLIELQKKLKSAGAIVWMDSIDAPHGSSRLADVRIAVNTKTDLLENLKPQPHTLNVLWSPHGSRIQNLKSYQGWHPINQMPTTEWLNQKLEESLGNTFCTP